MISENISEVKDFRLIHIRDCIVVDAGLNTMSVQPRDGREKGELPLKDVQNVVTLPGKAVKGMTVTVIFFRPFYAKEDAKWDVVWGNAIFPKIPEIPLP